MTDVKRENFSVSFTQAAVDQYGLALLRDALRDDFLRAVKHALIARRDAEKVKQDIIDIAQEALTEAEESSKQDFTPKESGHYDEEASSYILENIRRGIGKFFDGTYQHGLGQSLETTLQPVITDLVSGINIKALRDSVADKLQHKIEAYFDGLICLEEKPLYDDAGEIIGHTFVLIGEAFPDYAEDFLAKSNVQKLIGNKGKYARYDSPYLPELRYKGAVPSPDGASVAKADTGFVFGL